MTNRDIVSNALSRIKNVSGGVDIDSLFDFINAGNMNAPILSRDQIRKAMTNRKNVIKIDRGVWRIKGRSTPAK